MSLPLSHEGKISNADIPAVRQRLTKAFLSNVTKPYEWRKTQVEAVLGVLTNHKQDIIDAVHKDLGRHAFEIITSEINVCKVECETILDHLADWMQPERVPSNLATLPGSSYVYRDPYGVVLIVSPWNYPVQLSLVPLVGALAAGNAVYLKLSRHSPHTSACLERLLLAVLDRRAVAIESEGGASTITALNQEHWDYVFFTGSVSVGRIVYEAAAKNLTPVTLELGGKNPCIVDSTIDLSLAAKRIAWAKFFNCGQTCITVDYILVVGEARRNELVRHLKTWITSFYGWNPRLSDSYGNIVSVDHAKRLEGLFSQGTVVHGGIAIAEERYVAPTLITNPRLDGTLMQDEVFGPIIPIIVVNSVDEAIQFVNARPHALALYAFSADEDIQARILRDTRSGAALVNECLLHPSNHHLPFGGVGASGLGNYHGERSFKTFTHERAVIHQATKWWLDVPLRYPPYSNFMTSVADFITAGGFEKLAARLKWVLLVVAAALLYIKRNQLKSSARQLVMQAVMKMMSSN